MAPLSPNSDNDVGPGAPSTSGGVGRTIYAAASGGILGLGAWLLRGTIRRLARRSLTGPVAACGVAGAVALLALGNRLHLDVFRTIAGWSLLLIPLLWLMGWIGRTKEASLELEHGRNTDRIVAELDADERRQDHKVTEGDWLVDPPWERQPDNAPGRDRRPQFGRR